MIHIEPVLGDTGCLFAKGNCIPFYRVDSRTWILLDTGSRQIRQELDAYLQQNGIRICAVVCSHAHFDHVENARYLQETYGARIVMSAVDAGMVHDPTALKACFYSHTRQDNERYEHEMLCRADEVFMPWQSQVRVGEVLFQVLPLPGHAASHVGYVTPDGVAYLADSVFSPDTSGREHLTYMLDWTQALKTLEKIRGYDYKRYILAHRGVYEQVEPLAEENLHRYRRLLGGAYTLFTEEVTLDELLKKAACRYHFSTEEVEKACLFERIVRSMAEYLLEQGKICRRVREGVVVYGQEQERA